MIHPPTPPSPAFQSGTLAPAPWPRLEAFVLQVFSEALPRRDQRTVVTDYLRGLLAYGQRKSMRAMALNVGTDPRRFQHLLKVSSWDYTAVRRTLAERALRAFPPQVLAVRTVSVRRFGTRLAAAARQYAPESGRLMNCQVIVGAFALGGATALPLSWRLVTDVPLRSVAQARGTAAEHARSLVDETAGWSRRPLAVYLDDEHVDDGFSHLEDDPRVAWWAARVAPRSGSPDPGPSREPVRLTWQEGVTGPVHAQFRMLPGAGGGPGRLVQEHGPGAGEWLFHGRGASLREVVGLTRSAGRVTREIDLLREHLGLNGYEGRSVPGWHRHTTLVGAARLFMAELTEGIVPDTAPFLLRGLVPDDGSQDKVSAEGRRPGRGGAVAPFTGHGHCPGAGPGPATAPSDDGETMSGR